MRDINIVIDSQTHKVQFPDNFLGLNAENLQGTINFTFKNGFVGGIARLELAYDSQQGYIPNLEQVGESYTLPILSSLLTTDEIVMQLVIDQTDLTTYKLTTDTQINHQKTYYTRSGVEGEYVYTIVEHPNVADIDTYYEAQTPIFKTEIFLMTVGESINAVGTIPDEYPSWIDTLNSLVGQVNAKIIEMNQALAEVDNLDITATKEGTIVTITITRKDGSQQVVELEDGKDGVGIEKIEKTGTNLLVDTYTIYYTDDSTSTFQVTNGRGIVSIEKTGTNVLTDTYTITYNDNTTSTFTVVNGNGISNIEKIGTSGLIDTYRISYTNGEYYDYELTNGNGIDRIEKTGTVDNVDTYTIYYTNGTTSTYTVTNSTVTNQEFEELQDRVEYLGKYGNALIKNTDTGTSLTINDTANCPMPMVLSPSELGQAILPEDYQQVDYIESTGTQYINTGQTVDIANSTIELEAEITRGTGSHSPFGVYDTNNYYCLNFSGTENNIIVYINSSSGTATFSYAGNQRTLYKLTPNSLFADNTQLGTFTAGTGTTTNNLYLFGSSRNNGNVAFLTTMKLYNCKMYNGTTLLRNFIPCYRKSDNVIGLYDLVNDVFYSNAGTGDFIKGNNVPNPNYPQDIHTISGDNSIYINTKNLGYEGWAQDFVNRINNDLRAKLVKENGRNCLYYTANAGYQEYDTKYMFKTNFKENTRYTFKFMVKVSANYQINLALNYTDGTYEQISYNQAANIWSTALFTSASGKTIKYLRVAYYSGNCYIDLDTFQVKEGITIGNYEKGYQQLLPLTLGDLEYCKIGNYADEFVLATENDIGLTAGKWYLKKNIKKIVFNGSESWTQGNVGQNYTSFHIDLSDIVDYTNANATPNVYINSFIPVSYNSIWTPGNMSRRTNAVKRVIFITENTQTLEGWGNWLSTNNVIMYYQLATPEYILLNDTLQSQLTEIYNWLLSYQDQTNISQKNADLPIIITATTVYDLNKLLTRVEILESEV